MPATVEKLPDEPIIIVTITGHLDVELALSIYAQIAALAADMAGPIYRITDVRQQETTFSDMIEVIKEASKGTVGTTTDPRFTHIFVGREKMARIARDVMQRINPHNHPMLDTLEDALIYIRYDLARRQQTNPSSENG